MSLSHLRLVIPLAQANLLLPPEPPDPPDPPDPVLSLSILCKSSFSASSSVIAPLSSLLSSSVRPTAFLLWIYTTVPQLIRLSHRKKLPLPSVSHHTRCPIGEDKLCDAIYLLSELHISHPSIVSGPSLTPKTLGDFLVLFAGIVTINPFLEVVISATSFFMRSEFLSSLWPRNFLNVFTELSSCVVVCTGPEEANEIVSTIPGGRASISMSHSKVTYFKHSDFVVKILSTYLSLASDSLSSYQVLSALSVNVFNLYGKRGWLIPSICYLDD